MNRTYFADMMASDRRFEERRMLFVALRERRRFVFPRGLVASLFWLFGAR